MKEKELMQRLVSWSASLELILGPLDARDHILGDRAREVCKSIKSTRSRIESEGIKR